MPSTLLHVGATVLCMHGGQATPTVPDLRVRVGGQPIVTQPNPFSVAGCAFVPPTGNGPCVTGQWVTGGVRVRAGGSPVLLRESQAICTPTGTPLNVVMTQVRVRGT